MNIIPPLLRRLYAPTPVMLSATELEDLLAKGIAQSRNDDDIDACIGIMKRYRDMSPAYDAAIGRLNRSVLLQRWKVSCPLRPLKGELSLPLPQKN